MLTFTFLILFFPIINWFIVRHFGITPFIKRFAIWIATTWIGILILGILAIQTA